MTDCWIQTYSGVAFDLLEPKPDMVRLIDIAHALSQICRFTGHTRRHYSVAQHSVVVYEQARIQCVSEDDVDNVSKYALLHDAAEAYIGDVSRPLKLAMRRLSCGGLSPYDNIEKNIADVIYKRFSVSQDAKSKDLTQTADTLALMSEQRDLLGPQCRPWSLVAKSDLIPISPLCADDACDLFMRTAARLNLREGG